MAIPCKHCGSPFYKWYIHGKNSRCSDCPATWGERLVQLLAVLVVVALVVGLFGAYGFWAYDDWTCGFKHCVDVAER